MSILSQDQINTLKNKGLTDEKIAALAASKGMEMPKTSFWKGVGQSLIKSQKGFGQSIAGALGGNAQKGSIMYNLTGQKAIDEANQMNQVVTNNLLNKIKEKRAAGEDTTRLMEALKTLDKEVNFYDILNVSTGGSLDKSAKQVFGEGLGVATDILSMGSYGKAATGAKYSGVLGKIPGLQKGLPSAVSGITKATTFGQGTLQGMKQGAKAGSLISTARGATGAMQEDLSGKEIVGRAVGGGIAGGIIGGVVGGVTGGISGAIRGRGERITASQQKSALEAVTPNTKNIPKDKYIKLLDQRRITPKTGTKGSQFVLSKSEQATAQKYSKLLNQKDPIKNLNNIADEIAKQDDAVGAFLDKNNKVFNPQNLKSSLNESLKDLTDVTVDEKVVLKGKQKLIDNFIKNLKQNDMKTLWTARKEFDQQIEKAFTGSRTLQNKLKTEFRNSVQKFIGDNTPDTVYSDAMKEMSNLYKVKDLLKFKAAVEKGNSAVVLWIKNNPIKAKAIGLGIPGVVGSAMLLN